MERIHWHSWIFQSKPGRVEIDGVNYAVNIRQVAHLDNENPQVLVLLNSQLNRYVNIHATNHWNTLNSLALAYLIVLVFAVSKNMSWKWFEFKTITSTPLENWNQKVIRTGIGQREYFIVSASYDFTHILGWKSGRVLRRQSESTRRTRCWCRSISGFVLSGEKTFFGHLHRQPWQISFGCF